MPTQTGKISAATFTRMALFYGFMSNDNLIKNLNLIRTKLLYKSLKTVRLKILFVFVGYNVVIKNLIEINDELINAT